MLKKIILFIVIGLFGCLFCACGPSEEKVLQAQKKYRELVEVHNQVVEAHKLVEDGSLDEELVLLQNLMNDVTKHNLNEMEDEGIDVVIASMDSLIASYQEYETKLAEAKAAEEAAVLVDIPVTLFNQTGIVFTSVSLYEKGDKASKRNLLIEKESYKSGETMTGLMIQRDVDGTAWILELSDEEENTYEIEIVMKELKPDGEIFTLSYNEETETVELE